MPMLGAELADLEALAQQLSISTTRLDQADVTSRSTQQTVCNEMQASFASGIAAVQSVMGDLASIVSDANSQLGATMWTGANRTMFDSAVGDFGSTMSSLQGTIDETWTHFNAEIAKVSDFLETFQGEVSAHLGQAQQATTGMQQAVIAQRDNLDAAMNGSAF